MTGINWWGSPHAIASCSRGTGSTEPHHRAEGCNRYLTKLHPETGLAVGNAALGLGLPEWVSSISSRSSPASSRTGSSRTGKWTSSLS
jgi:hypothetical protein